MSTFHIEGGHQLVGRVNISGSKNAAFPILAATVLLSDPITLYNLPDIQDIRCFLSILEEMGARIVYEDTNIVTIDSTCIATKRVPSQLGSQMSLPPFVRP